MYAGTQCTCNALMFLVKMQKTNLMSSMLLNEILHEGMNLYLKIANFQYLLVDQLPTTVEIIHKVNYNVSYFEPFMGDLIVHDSKSDNSTYFNIKTALSLSFGFSNTSLLTTKDHHFQNIPPLGILILFYK